MSKIGKYEAREGNKMSGFEEVVVNDFDKANEMPINSLEKLKQENHLLRKSRSEMISFSAEWQDKWEKAQAEIDSLKTQLKDKDQTIKAFTERYTDDCIRINQLQTTIDVLIDKCARLRDVKRL